MPPECKYNNNKKGILECFNANHTFLTMCAVIVMYYSSSLCLYFQISHIIFNNLMFM